MWRSRKGDLRAHAPVLGARILTTYPPLQSTRDPVAAKIATLLRTALPAQSLAIPGTAYLRHAESVRIVAECGRARPSWRSERSMSSRMPYLHQAMQTWGQSPGLDVTLTDGDAVSETNCIRHPFSVSDIGLNKAPVLINRINLF